MLRIVLLSNSLFSTGKRQRSISVIPTRSSLYFGLLDSSFVRLEKSEREIGNKNICRKLSEVTVWTIQVIADLGNCAVYIIYSTLE